MRGVNNASFFNLWQMLYRSTCPNPNQTHWRVGEVEWRKDRHSFSGSDYGVTLEVHRLKRASRATSWDLMVMVEHWWDGAGNALKSTNWARVTKGNPKTIIAWLREQERPQLSDPVRRDAAA